MIENVSIRSAQSIDDPNIGIFLRKIFAEMGWIEEPRDHLPDAREYTEKNNGAFFVVFHLDKLIGTAALLPLNKKDIILKRFYIEEDFRGKGLAQELLLFVLDAAKKLEFERLVLDVSKTNTRAINFYKKNNFTQYSPIPNENWSESNDAETHDYYQKNL